MNRRKLGPPPSWIPAAKPGVELEAGEAADPLKNIFSASRTARLGDAEEDILLQSYVNRRDHITDQAVQAELAGLLMVEKRRPSPFGEIVVAPSSNADVRDTRGVRLVLLSHLHTHTGGAADSIARKKSAAFLSHYGVGPRRYRNTLVFLAADATKIQELLEELRSFLGWKSLVESPGSLEPRLIERSKAQVARFVERREGALREAYSWLLTPMQKDPESPQEWSELPLIAGSHTLAEGAASSLAEAGLVRIDDLGLAEDIDAARSWLGDSIHSASQLTDEFGKHLYLPRLIDEWILLSALQTALNAGIKPRVAASGPRRLLTHTLRLDQDDLARIAPQLLSRVLSVVSPVDLKLTLQIDVLVPDSSRPQLEAIFKEGPAKP